MSTFPRHSDQTATRPAPEISEERDSTRTPEDVRKEHDFARAYLNLCGEADIDWIMIRAAGVGCRRGDLFRCRM